ncbi:hypothetical protein [Leptolyngbya sp. 7M]|nr:hypothetical protein [Leptolyngbya sp. 7M]QYO63083.1 hypothetical protein JVX88_24390 [Leptolyngbya sp. 7M]
MAPIEVLNQISDVIWEIPVSYKDGMRVPARIMALFAAILASSSTGI